MISADIGIAGQLAPGDEIRFAVCTRAEAMAALIAREQRPNTKAYFNTRMWVKRDGRWQMLFNLNTRIE